MHFYMAIHPHTRIRVMLYTFVRFCIKVDVCAETADQFYTCESSLRVKHLKKPYLYNNSSIIVPRQIAIRQETRD